LFFPRAVLLRDETQIARDLAGAFETSGHVERGDKRTGGDWPDAGQRRESFHDRI
jgi:hypothetical protein